LAAASAVQSMPLQDGLHNKANAIAQRQPEKTRGPHRPTK
jgi:hypothetical protein